MDFFFFFFNFLYFFVWGSRCDFLWKGEELDTGNPPFLIFHGPIESFNINKQKMSEIYTDMRLWTSYYFNIKI